MGGRGASSGKKGEKDYLTLTLGGTSKLRYKGYRVTFQDETNDLFFTNVKGINYVQRGVGTGESSIPEKTPMNFSAEEYIRRAKSNGATVEKITQKQVRRMEKTYIQNSLLSKSQ